MHDTTVSRLDNEGVVNLTSVSVSVSDLHSPDASQGPTSCVISL